MRLAVEVTTCTSSRAGIGYYTEHLVDALMQTRAADDEIVLLSNRVPDPALTRRWGSHLRVGGPAVRALWLQTHVPRMLVEAGADVAVFPNYIVPLAAPCPTVSVVHDLAVLRTPQLFTWRKRVVTQSLLGRSVAAAAAVATVSEASRHDITTYLGVPPQRVVMLPGAAHPSCGPVSAEAVATVRAKHGLTRPYILTVGTIEPRKNLLTLLSAFDQLRRDGAGGDIELVVVGGRGWRDRKLVEELEARTSGGQTRWLGYVPEEDLIALYGGARLFVYPSRLEGFGLPVLEAMQCGAPVIASDVSALREVAGDAADFVPAGDVPALGAAIARVLADPARAARLRELGLARARKFSWGSTAERLWALAHRLGPAREKASRKPVALVSAPPAGPAWSASGDAHVSSAPHEPSGPHGLAVPTPTATATTPPSTPTPMRATERGPRPLATASGEAHPPRVTPARPTASPLPIGAPPAGMSPREWSLLAAVIYADLFDAPLPIEEVERACIGASFSEDEARRAVAERALAPHLVFHPSGYIVLRGREALVTRRQEGIALTKELLQRHHGTLKALASLPFVRMLAFSGGTTHQNPGRKPDIDLFVVTQAGRLYSAYSLLVLFSRVTRSRNVVCPNYLVDENELLIAYHHDLFTANQLVSARALSGPETYAAFCDANADWVRGYYPGFRPRAMTQPAPGRLQGALEVLLLPLAGPLERLARVAWRYHLGQRAARANHPDVVFGDGILKLHLSDYRRRVLERFAARLDAIRELGRGSGTPDSLAVGS